MFDIMHDLKARKITASSGEQNRLLIKKIQEGSSEAREEYITRNIPLVIACVQKFLKTRPAVAYLKDDLLSEGMNALTMASRSISGGRDPKQVYSYLIKSIFRDFIRLIKAEAGEFERPLNEEDEELLEINLLPATNLKCDIEVLAGKHSDIPRMRYEGYANVEIADRLGISTSTIRRKLHHLEKRLDQEYA